MVKKTLIIVWGTKCQFHSLVALLFTFVVIAIYLTGETKWRVEDQAAIKTNPFSQCNLFSGKWVYDNNSYPLYKEHECTFMWDEFACQKFGRKDLNYQNWRWQPHDCDLPRFNARELLERIRGKRVVYVGDSLNRDQWVSMVCLVESAIPPTLKSKHINGNLLIFTATFNAMKEYNATIEFYWAPLLVESNSDNPVSHRLPDRIVRIKSIEKHARHWTNADILVFNSYLWWRRPKMKLLWGSFESPDQIIKEVEMLRSYEMALKTWSEWLDCHINRAKTRLFFMSMSPTHLWGAEWGRPQTENCYNETMPIFQEGYWGSGSDMRMMRIAAETIQQLRTRGLKIQMLNITQLSEYRKEAHPAIHRRQWVPLTEEQKANPTSYADCVHWCLPGVPDVWNELLYVYILYYFS
ncbi:unnamed protein product [Camellia sinensis]